MNKNECNNFEKVFSYEHLLKSADLCKRNVFWKASVQNFMYEKEFNVSVIHNELMNDCFKVKHRHKFQLFERGKLRTIQSVHIRERIVQRCLCDYCLTPLLVPTFCYDNCASIKNKGISFALDRVKRHLQKYYRENGNNGYVLLFDYADYFGSIDHEMIMQQLKKYVTDQRLLNIIQIFLDEFDKGLGLGSQVSQVLSLFAASPIDHMIKDELRFKYFIRYMDDGLIIHKNRKILEELLKKIIEKSKEYGLTISEKKTRIVSIKHFRFLKKRFSLLDNGKIIIKLSEDSITRMRRKLKKFEHLYLIDKMSIENIETSYKSWRGFALQYDSYNTVKKLDEYFNELIKKLEKYDILRNLRKEEYSMNKYVKVVDTNNNIVDALDILYFVKWNQRANMVDNCRDTDKNKMGLLSYDSSTIWHLIDTPEFPNDYHCITVTYEEIDKEEFDILRNALDEGKEIEPTPTPDPEPEEDTNSVAFVKSVKIAEMKKTCDTMIENGIDVILSDDKSHHFSLTVQDQLNLTSLFELVKSGETQIAYHADGELCKFYPAEDITAIVTTAKELITYHTTYYNSLYAYIKSLRSINTISQVTYGMEIPDKYQSDVWKEILQQSE